MSRFRLLAALFFAGSIAGTVGIASAVLAAPRTGADTLVNAGDGKSAVLVELFTSEGCSSCPPADRLLAKIQKTGPSVIVLSEHVTYWNKLGWRDPFSSQVSTGRQSDYVQRLHLDSSYTPQMVVNGRYEFVGSDAGSAAQAIQKAAAGEAVPVTISDLKTMGEHLSFEIETGAVGKEAQVFAVLAQDEGEQHVANGENGGRVLRHVQIARALRQVANVKSGQSYKGSLLLDLPPLVEGNGWHVVVFLQQGSGGPVLGAASQGV